MTRSISRFSLFILSSIISFSVCLYVPGASAQDYIVSDTKNTIVKEEPQVCTPNDIIAVCNAIYNNVDDFCGLALDVMQCLGVLDCETICNGHPQPVLCKIGCRAFVSNPNSPIGANFRQNACKTVKGSIKKPLEAFCKNLIKVVAEQ